MVGNFSNLARRKSRDYRSSGNPNWIYSKQSCPVTIKLSKTKGTNLKDLTHQSTKRTANIGLIYQVKTSYRNDGESRTPSHAGTLEILLPDLSLKEQTNKIK